MGFIISNDPYRPEAVVQSLLKKIPVFKDFMLKDGVDDETPYIVFDSFARFLARHALAIPADPVLHESFEFINDLIAHDKGETQNMVVVQVFEVLAQTPHGTAIARRELSPEALVLFEETYKHWGPQRGR